MLSKQVLNEARYLLREAKVPLCKVSTRLRIPLHSLKRIRDSADDNLNPIVDGRSKVPRFSKIHKRARDLIDIIIDGAKTPLTLR